MRLPLLVFAVGVAVGCSSSAERGRGSVTVPATPPPADHVLHDRSEATADVARIRYDGRSVSVADIPAAAMRLGLPVLGTADVAIDVSIPIANGARDYRRARGTVDIRCTKCQLGDDVAKLKHAADFVGDGIYFGHVAFDRLEARLQIGDGRIALARWVVDSPDVTIELALDIDLASTYEGSGIRGCLRFKDKPALRQRDPKMSALLSITGAPLGPDGLFHVELAGTLGEVKWLGRACGEPSQP
jgi:hypothetical protein